MQETAKSCRRCCQGHVPSPAWCYVHKRNTWKATASHWDTLTGTQVHLHNGGCQLASTQNQTCCALPCRDDISICRNAEGKKCRLGEGGFGVVYKALMNGCDEVAVKLVKADKPSPKDMILFHKEVRHASAAWWARSNTPPSQLASLVPDKHSGKLDLSLSKKVCLHKIEPLRLPCKQGMQ